MRKPRTALATVGAVVVLVSPLSVGAAAETPEQPRAAAAPAPCTGQYEGDARLGPRWLPGPDDKPVGPLLKGYQRTGELSSEAFLKKYWEGPADSGGWKYPPDDGFARVNGVLDKRPARLPRGEELDRFGSEYGRFLAPAGDLYEQRSLPPQSLNTRDAASPCDYRVYRVTKPFVVWQGGIAPWFEQPGGGRQILLDDVFLPTGEDERANVKWLIDHGYLERVSEP